MGATDCILRLSDCEAAKPGRLIVDEKPQPRRATQTIAGNRLVPDFREYGDLHMDMANQVPTKMDVELREYSVRTAK